MSQIVLDFLWVFSFPTFSKNGRSDGARIFRGRMLDIARRFFVVTALRASKHRSEDEHANIKKETFLEKETLYNQRYIYKCPKNI